MTDEQTKNIPIGIEQLLAATLSTIGSVSIKFDDLIKDYSGKTISVDQNNETMEVKIELVNIPEDQAGTN
jgi:hypothetical protein